MRQLETCLLIGALGWSQAAADAAITQSPGDRIEMIDWSDPERAEQFIDASPLEAAEPASQVPMLEVRGMVYADVHRDADVEITIARLQTLARQGDASANPAAHYVRAYLLYRRHQFAAAGAELAPVNIESIAPGTERYRVAILRGNTLRMLGQAEAALPLLERALDLAHGMHDDLRSLHAMILLARIGIDTGNFERASSRLESARALAMTLGDEAALAEVEGCVSYVAERRGDRAAERRASLAALEHAERSGSNKWLAYALVNLGDSFLKTGDYIESLKYSKQALQFVSRLRASGDEPSLLFNEGLAYIGLGRIQQGEILAERAIADGVAGDSVLDVKDFLREYADALEHAGYLRKALQVYHRYEDVSDKSMTLVRQRAFLELSAKFDDARRTRELAVLRRDNALQAAQLRGERGRQQLMVAAALGVTCVCAALLWALARVRKANERLRTDRQRDALDRQRDALSGGS